MPNTITRREALKTAALATAAAAVLPQALGQTPPATAPATPNGPFTLPPLPYATDALEPHLDARTMEIHHGKHHAAYVTNLNKAVADSPELAKKSVESLVKDLHAVPEAIRMAVRNNGGGHLNHSLFWQMMKKDGGGEPKGELAKAIETSFSSFAVFKTKFADAALKVFGSGWAWLEADLNQRLSIVTKPNQDTFVSSDMDPKMVEAYRRRYGIELISPAPFFPLLGLDVWEHAYYLKYQNRRAEYIAAWWNVVNWDFVAERYASLKK
jgi:Fe-Mn family superoxide dismutase